MPRRYVCIHHIHYSFGSAHILNTHICSKRLALNPNKTPNTSKIEFTPKQLYIYLLSAQNPSTAHIIRNINRSQQFARVLFPFVVEDRGKWCVCVLVVCQSSLNTLNTCDCATPRWGLTYLFFYRSVNNSITNTTNTIKGICRRVSHRKGLRAKRTNPFPALTILNI